MLFMFFLNSCILLRTNVDSIVTFSFQSNVFTKKRIILYIYPFDAALSQTSISGFLNKLPFLLIFVVLYQKSIQCFFKECLLSQKSDVLVCFFYYN